MNRSIVLIALALSACAGLQPVRQTAILRGLSLPDPCGFALADGVVRLAGALDEPTASWCDAGRLAEMLLARGEPVHLVGHSLGADAAMRVAHFLRRHGAQVGKIFLIDPTDPAADMTGFDATAFISRDSRARPPRGALIIRRPDLGHVEMAGDPAVQQYILERIR